MSGAQRLRFVPAVVVCLVLCLAGDTVARTPGEAYDGWDIHDFEVIGIPGELHDTLVEGLALSGRRQLLRRHYPVFTPELLQQDLQRARLFLARKGYPDVRVEPSFTPRSHHRQVKITLSFTLGPRVHIGRIDVQGVDATRLGDRKRWPIQPGDAYDEARIEEAKKKITERVSEQGYARTVTTVHIENRQPEQVDLVFEVTPGTKQYFGDLRVDGVPEDLEKVARQSVQIRRGQLFSPKAVTRTDENLRFLGLFRRVHLSLRETALDTLALDLDLSERAHRQLLTGVGYFTDDHLRLRAEWSHNNLFHEGRGLGIVLRGTIYEQVASVSVWKPALLRPRTRGTLTFSVTHQNEDNYEAVLNGASAWITQILSLDTTLRYGLEASYNDYRAKNDEAVDYEETQGLLTALVFNAIRETARDRLWPLNGSTQNLRVRWAPPGGISEARFLLVEPDVAIYRHPTTSLITAGRLRLGLGWPYGDTELPPNERYYAGGASSHRGFARRKLGPKDSAGAALGGAAKVESSLEVRFPLFRSLFGATFVDAGQVWNHMGDAQLRDLEVAAGLGVMMKTPAGPLRIDYAWRVTDQDRTQPVRQFHFSIGNPY